MTKVKKDAPKKVQHPHLRARLSFLQDAAQLLEQQQHKTTLLNAAHANTKQPTDPARTPVTSRVFHPKGNAIARVLSQHTTAISMKTKIRIPQELKRTICKGCSSKLIDGQSNSTRTENRSKDCRKAWADVSVVTCLSCGLEKRFPVGRTPGAKHSSIPSQP